MRYNLWKLNCPNHHELSKDYIELPDFGAEIRELEMRIDTLEVDSYTHPEPVPAPPADEPWEPQVGDVCDCDRVVPLPHTIVAVVDDLAACWYRLNGRSWVVTIRIDELKRNYRLLSRPELEPRFAQGKLPLADTQEEGGLPVADETPPEFAFPLYRSTNVQDDEGGLHTVGTWRDRTGAISYHVLHRFPETEWEPADLDEVTGQTESEGFDETDALLKLQEMAKTFNWTFVDPEAK